MVIKIDIRNNSVQTALKKSISWEIHIKKNGLQENNGITYNTEKNKFKLLRTVLVITK